MRFAAGLSPARRGDDLVSVLGQIERIEPESAASENLTGLLGPVSGGRVSPPQVAARNAAPVHVLVEERDEGLDVALVERRSGRSQPIDHERNYCTFIANVLWE